MNFSRENADENVDAGAGRGCEKAADAAIPTSPRLCPAPLDAFSTVIYLMFTDDTGADLDSDMTMAANVHLSSTGAYEAVFPYKDLHYRHHYGLSGGHGLKIVWTAPLGVSGKIQPFDIASSLTLLPGEVGALATRARVAGRLTSGPLPGYVDFARAGRSECVALYLLLEVCEFAVCVRSVVIDLSVEDAAYVADRLRLARAQRRG